MEDRRVPFGADLTMTGADSGPGSLLADMRPNLWIDGGYYPCVVLATLPEAGVPRGSSGAAEMVALCPRGGLTRFAVGTHIELRVASKVFATGIIAKVGRSEPLDGISQGRFSG
jgi:hypothetical protein